MANYRYDYRTKEQFQKDVKDSTLQENSLIKRWLDHVEAVTGERPVARRTSSKGAKGEYLESKDVTADADFIVEGYGLVEVKFAKPLIKTNFHLKVSQVNKYIAQNANILMVNGAHTDSPKFAFIRTRRLRELAAESEQVSWRGFGGKLAYRIPIRKVRWSSL